MVACAATTLLMTANLTFGCARRSIPSTVPVTATAPTSPLDGQWQTRGQLGTRKTMTLAGGNGFWEVRGDPVRVITWTFDGTNLTWRYQDAGQPPTTVSQRCVVSSDGSNFRLLTGIPDIDSMPVSVDDSTYYRINQ
jgi:hypothetical protein